MRIINGFLVVGVLVSGFTLYSLEHSTRSLEREIIKVKASIADREDAIKLLNAEWSSLTRPDRIQQLAEQNLHLQVVRADQIVTRKDLPNVVPQEPVVRLEEEGSDPIGDILKKMQR